MTTQGTMNKTDYTPKKDPLSQDYIAALLDATGYHINPAQIAVILRVRVPFDPMGAMYDALKEIPHSIAFYSDFLGSDLDALKGELICQKKHIFRRDYTSQAETYFSPILGEVRPGIDRETVLEDGAIDDRLKVDPYLDPKLPAIFWKISHTTQTHGYPVKTISTAMEYRLVAYIPGGYRGNVLEGSVMSLIWDSLPG